MRFRSTRGDAAVTLEQALVRGLAPDGGLYVPDAMPSFTPADFDSTEAVDVAARYLAPFLAGTSLEPDLEQIVAETFSFPLPLVDLSGTAGAPLYALELFHGPTAAFKDVGARFLAACLSRLDAGVDDPRPLTILVATSGDTGGAVAAAFHRRPGIEVVVLFPEGRVSPRQQHQLCCWGDNVTSLSVAGGFDDCQALVKAAFTDPALSTRFRFSSANSINIGRLLPQSVYYAISSLQHYARSGTRLSYAIPTGNLGNALAAVLARAAGLPIGDILLVTNANRTVPDYLSSGVYEGRASVATIASAMDVGDPSNMERLRHLFGEAPELRALGLDAVSVDDEQIREQIRTDARRFGFAWCPHSATAMYAWTRHLDASARARPWAVVATAHPAKFETIVEPLVDAPVPVPPALAELLERPAEFTRIEPTLAALAEALS